MVERKQRVYGGMSADERRQQRRRALVDAGIELFGSEGYQNISVKRVCDEAGLTQRYFYESFSDREDLLQAVYRHCVEVLREATQNAAAGFLAEESLTPDEVPAEFIPDLVRLSLDAFIGALTQDLRFARIILIEVVGISPALEAMRIGALHDWADLLLDFTAGSNREPRSRLAAIGFIGAFTQLLVDWQMAAVNPVSPDAGPELFNVDSIRDVATELLLGTYDRIIGAGPKS